MSTLIERDLNTVWHPCAQMKDYQDFKPLPVRSARGVYVELEDGRRLIDAYSSWWCKNLGHGHPRLMAALSQQAQRFEHVGLAHTTSKLLTEFSEKLTGLTSTLNKVMFASDGSCAIEIALKLSLHSRQVTNQPDKTKIIALENGYHGETLWAMAVTDLGIYRDPYASVLPQTEFLRGIPYVNSIHDPLWRDCSSVWPALEAQLNQYAATATAIIVEPILQAAVGMRLYSADFLQRLRQWSFAHDVHLIADEVMTGLGRVGKPFACDYAGIEPDIMCLGKGLTAGVLPLSATLMTNQLYDLFYHDYKQGKNFLHSHTHTGNALALAVALECLQVLEEEGIYQQALDLQQKMRACFPLSNQRGIAGVIAADLMVDPDERIGFKCYQKAAQLGALLRPLGNTIYWCPPLNISEQELYQLADITKAVVSFYSE